MEPFSQRAGLDGRWRGRTDPGRPYQVPPRTDRRIASDAPAAGRRRERIAGASRRPPVRLWSMTPRRPFVWLLALVFLLAACGGTVASFDPSGPCTADGSAPGAYPELEARIPAIYEDRGPETLDSGRSCTPDNLGSLADAGIAEVRFAGGTWDFGGNRAAALVVFNGAGPDGRCSRRLLRRQRPRREPDEDRGGDRLHDGRPVRATARLHHR